MTMLVDDELLHYGVKGMRWGVRRYQKYDGSYTQKGVAKFDKLDKEYESALGKKKAAKASYKKGTGKKSDYTDAASEVKSKKKEMKKNYKKLRLDKMADKGKGYYKRGETITDNALKFKYGTAAIGVGALVASRIIQERGNPSTLNLSMAALGAGATIAEVILYEKTQRHNRRLRAYYAH